MRLSRINFLLFVYFMNHDIYLDANATSQVLACAVAAAVEAMETCYGNPSSTHAAGLRAKAILDATRACARRVLGAGQGRLHLALAGALRRRNLQLRCRATDGGGLYLGALGSGLGICLGFHLGFDFGFSLRFSLGLGLGE